MLQLCEKAGNFRSFAQNLLKFEKNINIFLSPFLITNGRFFEIMYHSDYWFVTRLRIKKLLITLMTSATWSKTSFNREEFQFRNFVLLLLTIYDYVLNYS